MLSRQKRIDEMGLMLHRILTFGDVYIYTDFFGFPDYDKECTVVVAGQ